MQWGMIPRFHRAVCDYFTLGGQLKTCGNSACCAHTASGHATAEPPSAASNSRRPMVTVIRPSRARCVKGTIPRLQCAVFTFEEAGCWLLSPGFGVESGKAQFSALPPKDGVIGRQLVDS